MRQIENAPDMILGGIVFNGCSAVSYFSTLVGSIIGAGRLSFRVRDGSGRFPVAISAVTLLCCDFVLGCVWWWGVVSRPRGVFDVVCGVVWLRVGKFSAG